MLLRITKSTRIAELISAGASADGKIIQQVIFIKQGLNVPATFFFTSDIIRKTRNGFMAKPSFHDSVLAPFRRTNCEYQIRTEGVNETHRVSDFFSESRLGLTRDNILDNLLSVVIKNRQIKKVVGLIQILPPKSLERNIISGLAQVITDDNGDRLYISLHRGLATYLARVGTSDATLSIPFHQTNKKNVSYRSFLEFKSRDRLFCNIALNLRRFGIVALTRYPELFQLTHALQLPWNKDRNRLKKEYEYSPAELCKKISLPSVGISIEVLRRMKENPMVSFIVKQMSLDFSRSMSLNDLLIGTGAYLIATLNDRHNGTKSQINALMNGTAIDHLISEDILRLIVRELRKLGKDLLSDHLCSFSVVYDEISGEIEMIPWDMPLDKKLSIFSKNRLPENLLWITSVNSNFSVLSPEAKDVGVDLKVTDTINMDLLVVLRHLAKYKNLKNIYVKYSLLSHPATIIREHGYNVISI